MSDIKDNISSALMSLAVILVLAASSICFAENSEAERLKRAESSLIEASNWFITEGLSQYLERNKNQKWIQKKMRDEWAVSTFSGPSVNNDGYDVRLIIKYAGVYSEIISLQHLIEQQFYEYWLVKTSGEEWTNIKRQCRFIVTKAENKQSKREILKDEPFFYDMYEIGESANLSLPLEDLKLRYVLAAWLYPNCYEDEELTKDMIVINSNKEFVKKKIRWWHLIKTK